MLNFNQNHLAADLTAISQKNQKAKKSGKVMLSGIILSAVLLLSGCGKTNEEVRNEVATTTPITAIIMVNGNAMIVDLQSYEKASRHTAATLNAVANDRTWSLYTTTGDTLLVDYSSVQFIQGENSHEKAETIAEALVGETGQITCYDEVQTYGKTR